MKTMITTAVLSLASAFAQAQFNPVEMQIGAVFIEQLAGVQAEVCPARDPGTKKAWVGALQAWKARNRDELAHMNRLAGQLEAHDPAFAVAAHSQFAVLVLHRLASSNDGDAVRVCGEFLKNLSNPKADAQLFADAKTATASILAKPK